MCPRALALALLAGLTGCERLGDAYNAHGLARDLPRLVAPTGVTLGELDCRWVRGTRRGTCTTHLDPPAVARLRSGLGLAAEVGWLHPAGCRARPGFGAGTTFARSLHGTGYVALSLVEGPAGTVCLELEYGYG